MSSIQNINVKFHNYVLNSKERNKGTKYIEDETGLICSEAIIINRILEENK